MQNELLQLSGCGMPWAENRAKFALQIAEGVQAGALSKEEARALLEDLINTDKLNEEATNAEARSMLVFGITQVVQLCL
jgi:polyhydroxyalkanoate synthesis regulator phasin